MLPHPELKAPLLGELLPPKILPPAEKKSTYVTAIRDQMAEKRMQHYSNNSHEGWKRLPDDDDDEPEPPNTDAPPPPKIDPPLVPKPEL
jgi:hypothetical protein